MTENFEHTNFKEIQKKFWPRKNRVKKLYNERKF